MGSHVLDTWTDNHGRWYARVYRINATPKATWERARRAIVSELIQREAPKKFRIPLEVFTRDGNTITYRERT